MALQEQDLNLLIGAINTGIEKQKIFYSAVIAADQTVVFFVEGEIDAMSIYEAGAEAIGLGSTSNVDKLIALIDAEELLKKKTYVICGDNDTAGKTAVQKLTDAFTERKIDYFLEEEDNESPIQRYYS